MSRRPPQAPPSGSIRAFVALDLPAPTRQRLAELGAALRPRVPDLRWVDPRNVHLTLRFLGDASPRALRVVEERLRAAGAACPPLEAPVRGLGVFPDRGSPRVLWLGVDLPAPALDLQRSCERAAVEAGFPREDRPFRSHLTLGRWREGGGRPDLPEVDLGLARLETLALFRSDLHPRGPTYTPLLTVRLGGLPG